MALLLIGLVAAFVVLPAMLGRMLWGTFGLRVGFPVKLAIVAAIAWVLWNHFQLPPEQTGGGWLLKDAREHPEKYGGQALPAPGSAQQTLQASTAAEQRRMGAPAR